MAGNYNKNSVKPLIDGENVFPEIAKIIKGAQRWCYIGIWGFDEEVRFHKDGQNNSTVPTAEKMLKKKDVSMLRSGTTPDIKVLVWNATAEDDYSGRGNNVGDISIVTVNWKEIKEKSEAKFIEYMRKRESAADEKLLLYFFKVYGEMETLRPDSKVCFPSGIYVVLQKHNTNFLGSHHQKFVLTEKACYIGGLNFHKEYWDTQKHELNNENRKSSNSSKDPGSLHDTGSIVQGQIIKEVLRTFGGRWNECIGSSSGYGYLTYWLRNKAKQKASGKARKDFKKHRQNKRDSIRFSDLENYLIAHLPSNVKRQAIQGVQFNSAADPKFTVNHADITVSLPRNAAWAGKKGEKEIMDHYMETLSNLTRPNSFIYMENQYFTDHRIVIKIEEKWCTLPINEKPFAYIAIPYEPQTHWLDDLLGGWFAKDEMLEMEMQNLKWLEIKTARQILLKDTKGQWVSNWKVTNPRTDIRFKSKEINSNPEKMKEDSKFEITNALRVGSDGKRIPNTIPENITLPADKVLTVSDIMTYTLVSSTDQILTSSRPQNMYRNFLRKNGIYIHSKCSIFLDCKPGGQNWATVGTANINPRGLDDEGNQDSEINVWWEKKQDVERFLRKLWKEHLNIKENKKADAGLWCDTGWKNLQNIMNGKKIHSSVVRLDVMDRLKHLA
ncbi:MAG: hypothetical protein GY775_18385 [Candidatus Scalindua sp.]|nr:hypothetical protein [Candidatus Scalindua sp.]